MPDLQMVHTAIGPCGDSLDNVRLALIISIMVSHNGFVGAKVLHAASGVAGSVTHHLPKPHVPQASARHTQHHDSTLQAHTTHSNLLV
jgi:hypothetical protein